MFIMITAESCPMELRTAFLFLGLSFILLLGCISIDYSQKVDRNGDSVITQVIDMSALTSLGSQYASASDQLSTVCQNLTKNDSSINCSYDSGVITVSKPVRAKDGQYNFTKQSAFPDVIYTLEVRKLPQVVDSGNVSSVGSAPQTDADFKNPSAKLGAASLKTAGVSMTYTIEMPGEIFSAENGEIVTDQSGRKSAKFDVLELMTDGEYIVVKSKELDLVMVAIAGGAVVLLVGGLAVAFVLLKAMKK